MSHSELLSLSLSLSTTRSTQNRLQTYAHTHSLAHRFCFCTVDSVWPNFYLPACQVSSSSSTWGAHWSVADSFSRPSWMKEIEPNYKPPRKPLATCAQAETEHTELRVCTFPPLSLTCAQCLGLSLSWVFFSSLSWVEEGGQLWQWSRALLSCLALLSCSGQWRNWLWH